MVPTTYENTYTGLSASKNETCCQFHVPKMKLYVCIEKKISHRILHVEVLERVEIYCYLHIPIK